MITRMMKSQFVTKHFSGNFRVMHYLSARREAI